MNPADRELSAGSKELVRVSCVGREGVTHPPVEYEQRMVNFVHGGNPCPWCGRGSPVRYNRPDVAARMVHDADRDRRASDAARVELWCEGSDDLAHERVTYWQSLREFVYRSNNGCVRCVLPAVLDTHPEYASRIVNPDDRLHTAGASARVLVWCAGLEQQHVRTEYMQSVYRLTSGSNGCTECGPKSPMIPIEQSHPHLAGRLVNADDRMIPAKSRKSVPIWCTGDSESSHERVEYLQRMTAFTAGTQGCQVCRDMAKHAVSVAVTHPHLAARLVHAADRRLHHSSQRTVTVLCDGVDSDVHEPIEYPQSLSALTRGSNGCLTCGPRGDRRPVSLSRPDIAARMVNASDRSLSAGSNEKALFWCDGTADAPHPRREYLQRVHSFARKSEGCRSCTGRGAVSIAQTTFAHRLVNPAQGTVTAGSESQVDVWCDGDGTHPRIEYRQMALSLTSGRNGCHDCGPIPLDARPHTRARLLQLLEGLVDVIDTLSPAALTSICRRWGLATTRETGQAIMSRDPDRLREIARQLHDADDTTAGFDSADEDDNDHAERDAFPDTVTRTAAQFATDVDDSDHDHDDPSLPRLSTAHTFVKATAALVEWSNNADEAQMGFLVASRVAEAWHQVYLRDDATPFVDELRTRVDDNAYSTAVVTEFLRQYDTASAMPLPAGWDFRPDGTTIAAPNLMQKHLACLVAERRHVGNWSSTGAGKTVSAVLAARHISADTIVVICPNNTVDGWERTIRSCFPDSDVATKTLRPVFTGTGQRWLIVNFDMLPGHDTDARDLIDTLNPDMFVIDEVHWAKHRAERDISQRRAIIMNMRRRLRDDAAVLGMSATPVINDLSEGASLIEMITGHAPDVDTTKVTIGNVIDLHRHMVRIGFRATITPDAELTISHPEIPIDDLADEIITASNAHPATIDAIISTAYHPTAITEALAAKARGRGLMIYTEYVKEIIDPLRDALEAAGLTVGLFTGTEKTPISDLATSNLDVLITTAAAGTGVDGIQHWSDTLMFISLPWTSAAFEQIRGRVYRQGTHSTNVNIVIPTGVIHNGTDTWSWTRARWSRVENKRVIAAAVMDGDIPSEYLSTPTEAARAALQALERLRASTAPAALAA